MKAADTVFPSSNWLGIPDLDPGLAVTAMKMPCWAWGSVARSSKTSGTWHFYVEDKRFARVLREPHTVSITGAVAATEPNISVFEDTPLASILSGIYRKRWVARFWQDSGMRILVDVNLPARVLERDEWRFGVPDGWPSFSTRGYECRVADLDTEYETAIGIRGGTTGLVFLIVGGGKQIAKWCLGKPGVIHSGYQAQKQVIRRGFYHHLNQTNGQPAGAPTESAAGVAGSELPDLEPDSDPHEVGDTEWEETP